MTMKKEYLLAPGPTPVPPEALLAMARPIFHHRTGRYRKIFQEVTENLRLVFQTKNDVLTFSSSGTGAMEATVVNVLSAGDTVVVVNAGKFGERWAGICKAYGVKVLEIKVPYGNAANPQEIAKALKADSAGAIKAVFTTLCETSTGALSDIAAIGAVVKNTSAALVVDAISGLGADDLQTDRWGVDVAVTGSQKGLMIPPGLAFAAVSLKAWKLEEKSTLPKYYFSFKKAKKSLEAWDNAFTPPVSLIVALRETLRMICEDGISNVVSRHARLAAATRAGIKALGLELYCPLAPANTVTAVKVPSGLDGVKLVKHLREELGVTIAGGQGDDMKGKLFRIAHLGYAAEFDVVIALSALEMALDRLGFRFSASAGVKAAQESLLEAQKVSLTSSVR